MSDGGSPDLSIGEVALRTGYSAATLRRWEAAGLLPPPPRVGGRRRYPNASLSRIAMIDLVLRAGFSPGEARELLGTADGAWRGRVMRKQNELDERLAALRTARRLLTLDESMRRNGPAPPG